MLGDTSYNRIDQSYELDNKTAVKQNVQEVSDDNVNDDYQPMLNQDRAPQPVLPPGSQWPHQPGSLVEDPRWEFMYDVYDSFLTFIAIVLILKTSLCIYAWSRDKAYAGKYLDAVSPLTLQLIRFNDQVITAFTIIFVTIMTTVTRRYALYQAQQGAYITDLEQLQASISLPSTIKMVFSLRKFTKFSVGLVFLWSFYYLGSQASKREYTLAVSSRFGTLSAAYPMSNASAYRDWDQAVYGPKVQRDFMSSIWGTNDAKLPTFGIDENGNILLPDPAYLYMLYPNGTVNNTHVHKIRPSDTTYLTFSGRPLWIRTENSYTWENGTVEKWLTWSDQRIVGDYSLHTSYLKLHCLSMDVLPLDQFPAGVSDTRILSLNVTHTNTTQTANNSSLQQLEFWQRWYNDTLLYDVDGNNVTAPQVGGTDGGAVKISCDIFEPRLNVDVHCTETACLTTSMYCPDMDPVSLRTTMLLNTTFAESFFSDMLLAEGIPRSSNDRGDLTNYLRLYDADILDAAAGTLNTTNKQIALDSQTSWLETIVNTYLNVAEQTPFSYNEDVLAAPAGFDTVKVFGAPYDPHYAVFWEWIAIDYVSGFLLLAAAATSFWLRKHTLVPDIFGFVSSLTRDNPHFPVPPGASTLDGISRTRAFRSVKVKIGDVGGPGEVGRIGFVPVHHSIPIEGLSKHRKYL